MPRGLGPLLVRRGYVRTTFFGAASISRHVRIAVHLDCVFSSRIERLQRVESRVAVGRRVDACCIRPCMRVCLTFRWIADAMRKKIALMNTLQLEDDFITSRLQPLSSGIPKQQKPAHMKLSF
eukprot:INCI17168.3.p2 GENE.INCI17168.3~~INCI17168.3.p2  ORF type:complete len:123 (-),score=1.87 INCI17168.3:12-380(-)